MQIYPRRPPQTKRPSIWYPKEYHHLPGFEKILKNIKKFHKNTNLLSYLYQKAKNKVRNLTKGKALQVRNLTKGKALQVKSLTGEKPYRVKTYRGNQLNKPAGIAGEERQLRKDS